MICAIVGIVDMFIYSCIAPDSLIRSAYCRILSAEAMRCGGGGV